MNGPVIVVMGVSGVGKTTFGTFLADRLGVGFIDADDHHSEENKRLMASGRPLTDGHRLPWLEAIAREANARRAAGAGAVVIACSALRRSYRDILRRATGDACFIHLVADAALIRRRMDGRSGHFMPTAMLDSQMATLEPLEPAESGFRLDVALPVEALAEQAIRELAACQSLPRSLSPDLP